MRYFDEKLIANSRPHGSWWGDVCNARKWFEHTEKTFANVLSMDVANAAAILPRDAWLEMDTLTRRIMRGDEGSAWMMDLMPLAKAVNIGKLVHVTRVSSDAGSVTRSMSGQVPNSLDKVEYAYHETPVPIFSGGYGREWRETKTFDSEAIDAIMDDQEAQTAKINRDMALYALDGDPAMQFKGVACDGIRTNARSVSINMGSGAGGNNLDLTTATPAQIESFINGGFGQMLDDNLVSAPVNLYVSNEIMRNLDQPYSGVGGFKMGSLREWIESNRRINKVVSTYELTGNEFFGFVPNSNSIRPLVGMAVNTTAITRMNPTDNYQFMVMGAMGLEIRADFSGKSGVFYSVVVN